MDNKLEKKLPEHFTDKYFIYNGTDTIEEMNENIEKLGLNRVRCYFIKLSNMFYAVFFGSFDREIIIGSNRVFYSRNGRLHETTIGEAKINFSVNSRKVMWITSTLAEELNYLYNPIEIFEYPTINSKQYRPVQNDLRLSNYVVLLGVTFSSRFYNIYEAKKMRKYFIHTKELISFLNRTKGAVALDPFTQEVRFEDGSIGTYSYKRVSEERYYSNKPGYYNRGNYGVVIIFALEERNKYSPFKKREWPSITRYKAMYPDDDIFYEMPDFREDKTKCKWCGHDLPIGKKNYCSSDCRIEFGQAVNVERGALLPYFIMSRDLFICQTCGKDMAYINEHGMKIPIPRVSDTPDSDNVCRSEAEVHHDVPVEEGGSDHQKNLSTQCQSCHKGKHKKRLTKKQREEKENK